MRCRCQHPVAGPPAPRRPQRRRRQRGVTMLFGLIALAVLMIGAAALVRSMNASAFNAGNVGFKRDLTNQSERAMTTVMALMNSGALGSEPVRQSHASARNYRATLLPSNAQGIPNALVDEAQFAAVGSADNDIALDAQGVKVRWLVDRLCAAEGAATTDGCTMNDAGVPRGTSATEIITAAENAGGMTGAVPRQVVYRLSIRVSGPRATQAFFQTTFAL